MPSVLFGTPEIISLNQSFKQDAPDAGDPVEDTKGISPVSNLYKLLLFTTSPLHLFCGGSSIIYFTQLIPPEQRTFRNHNKYCVKVEIQIGNIQ